MSLFSNNDIMITYFTTARQFPMKESNRHFQGDTKLSVSLYLSLFLSMRLSSYFTRTHRLINLMSRLSFSYQYGELRHKAELFYWTTQDLPVLISTCGWLQSAVNHELYYNHPFSTIPLNREHTISITIISISSSKDVS